MQTADKIHIKIPDQLYVGVQGKKEFDTTNPPLAFAIPYATSGPFKKNYEGSKPTVDHWSGYKQQHSTYDYTTNPPTRIPPPEQTEHGKIIDNEFREGFYFEKAVTRWETSNKFFRINDPRGFQLEIDSANLGDILLNSHISKGYLVGKFRWARFGGKAYLVREDHPSVLAVTNPAVKRDKKTLNVGDEVFFSSDPTAKYIYCGKKYMLLYGQRGRLLNIESNTVHNTEFNQQQQYHWQHTPAQREEARLQIMANRAAYYEINKPIRQNTYRKDLKPYFIFKHKTLNDFQGGYYLMRSSGTFEVVSENNEFTLPKFGEEAFKFSYYGYGGLTRGFIFETKKDLEAFEVTEQIITKANIKTDPWVVRSESYYTQHYPELLVEPTYQDLVEISATDSTH